MKFRIKHEIRGRIRLQSCRNKLTDAEADALQYYLSCRELVDTLTQGAVEALSAFPDPSFLCWLAESLVGRKN